MAKVIFVLMFLIIQNVFADINDANDNCDSCVQSRSRWCHENTGPSHCIFIQRDDSCPYDNYEKWNFTDVYINGDMVQPKHAEIMLYMHIYDYQRLVVTYVSNSSRNVYLNFTEDVKLSVKAEKSRCDARTNNCTVGILVKPDDDFCSHHKYVDVGVTIEGLSEVIIRYHVACTCECSKYKDIQSTRCNSRGNYTCGACNCESEWYGDYCEKEIPEEEVPCDETRGDQSDACVTEKNGELVVCNGNGKCVCSNCICYNDKVGSQYFDKSEKCTDVCQQTKDCHDCLLNRTLKSCESCSKKINLTLLELDQNIVDNALDQKNRLMWVLCKESLNDCKFDYYAAKDENGYYAMNYNCSATSDKIIVIAESSGNLALWWCLGVICVLVCAVAGIYAWKYMKKEGLDDTAHYATIKSSNLSEGVTITSPIYKSPTTSFTNPHYNNDFKQTK